MTNSSNNNLNKLQVKYQNEIKNIIETLKEMQISANDQNLDLLEDISTQDFEDTLKQIDNNDSLSKDDKADLYFQAFLDTQNPKFLAKSTANLSDQPVYSSIAWVVKTIEEYIKNDDLAVSYKLRATLTKKGAFDDNFLNELFSNLDLNELHQELFYDFNIVQKIINENFQNQKVSAVDNNESIISGWFNESINIKYEDAVEIGKFNGSTLYGKIASKFQTPATQSALEEGFASKSHGAEGVKLLDSKLFSLKTLGESGDSRLYTSVIHKNDVGDLLAIFDHSTKHSGLTKKVNAAKLHVFEDCVSELLYSDYTDTENYPGQDSLEICGVEANGHDLL